MITTHLILAGVSLVVLSRTIRAFLLKLAKPAPLLSLAAREEEQFLSWLTEKEVTSIRHEAVAIDTHESLPKAA
jgi:hypothetical protein